MANALVVPVSGAVAAAVGVALLKKYFAGGVCRSEERLDGKTVVITGANTGIGKETALDLAKRGARVIMACRDLDKANSAAKEVQKESGNGEIFVKKLDLASIDSIKAFAEEILNSEAKLDILINNAGIMRCPHWKTKDGFEMQFGVNHLGHFLLTNLLIDLLKKSAPCRVVNVSSLAHKRGQINFNDLNWEKGTYSPGAAYAQSKLANVLFTRELARRLEGTGVTVNSLHPGAVHTELGRHLGVSKFVELLLSPIIWLVLKTPQQGAQTTIYCAVSKDLDGVSGQYFSDCAAKEPAEQAKDDGAAKKLWEVSASMLNLDKTI